MSSKTVPPMEASFIAVIATEFLKLRRSKVTWMSFVVYSFIIIMVGFFMWIMKNPGMADSLGLLGKKANFAFGGESVDWSTFLTMVFQIGGMGGMIFLSFIAVFVFGREYVEGTEKNLLTLPVPRPLFVLAKLVVMAVWFALLSVWLLPLGYIVGSALELPGFNLRAFGAIGGKIMISSLLSFSLCPLVAWIAVATRGYFAPLGYAIFTLILASLFGHTGWAAWIPWSIVGLYSGATGSGPELTPGSYIVLAATFALGLGLTLHHETKADNVQ